MLAARGVSLGLGKINLSELKNLPMADRAVLGKLTRERKKRDKLTPKLIVRKHVDKRTLVVACKSILFAVTFTTIGLTMTVLGYFNYELATHLINNGTLNADVSQINDMERITYKGMQYIGPIFMGLGCFALIIACVMTLESRDNHTQVIQQESADHLKANEDHKPEDETTKISLLSPFKEEKNLESLKAPLSNSGGIISNGNVTRYMSNSIENVLSRHNETHFVSSNKTTASSKLSTQKFLNINTQKPKGPAPIVQADSLVEIAVTTSALDSVDA